MTSIPVWRWAAALLLAALALWLLLSSLGDPFGYGSFASGLILAWIDAFLWRGVKDSWLAGRGSAAMRPAARAPFSILLALAPGLILLWYGIFSPAQPSLARSGVDICEYQVGFCVSGSRAFIFFGGIALIVGLWVAYAIVKSARQP